MGALYSRSPIRRLLTLARKSHQLATAARDMPQSAPSAPFGMLDGARQINPHREKNAAHSGFHQGDPRMRAAHSLEPVPQGPTRILQYRLHTTMGHAVRAPRYHRNRGVTRSLGLDR